MSIIIDMKQFNINIDPEFESVLTRYMKLKKLTKKSEALRTAIREAVEAMERIPSGGFSELVGVGLRTPLSADAYKLTEDDLWG